MVLQAQTTCGSARFEAPHLSSQHMHSRTERLLSHGFSGTPFLEGREHGPDNSISKQALCGTEGFFWGRCNDCKSVEFWDLLHTFSLTHFPWSTVPVVHRAGLAGRRPFQGLGPLLATCSWRVFAVGLCSLALGRKVAAPDRQERWTESERPDTASKRSAAPVPSDFWQRSSLCPRFRAGRWRPCG